MSELEIPGLQILNEIGQGGMARVFLAVQESLQRPVAVKLLHNLDSPRFHERFMNEGRYLAALSHSNIVEVYDVGKCRGQYYILMEYLPGGDLKRRIQRGMKPVTALKLTVRIANCLDYLHDQGIVHRDLKPSNILFRADNNPVLTDFGIAKLLQDSGELTLGGAIVGSPSYLSPEQAGFSGEIDGRSDLYSLGVILYEMLTGERPFTGENFAAIIMAHHQHPIPLLPESLVHYQPIIERLLAKRPEDRFQTGAELIQAIRNGPIAEFHQLRRQGDMELRNEFEPAPAPVEIPGQDRSSKLVWRISWSILSVLCVGLIPIFSLNDGESILEGGMAQVDRQTAMLAHQVWSGPTEHPSRRAAPDRGRIESSSRRSPTAAAQPENTDLNEVERLLDLADSRMESLRLSYPKGDSAMKYFRDVLVLEPQNEAAQAGIRKIVRWYIEKAEESLEEGDVERAERFIHRGRLINAKHPKLMALQDRAKAHKTMADELYAPLNVMDY